MQDTRCQTIWKVFYLFRQFSFLNTHKFFDRCKGVPIIEYLNVDIGLN